MRLLHNWTFPWVPWLRNYANLNLQTQGIHHTWRNSKHQQWSTWSANAPLIITGMNKPHYFIFRDVGRIVERQEGRMRRLSTMWQQGPVNRSEVFQETSLKPFWRENPNKLLCTQKYFEEWWTCLKKVWRFWGGWVGVGGWWLVLISGWPDGLAINTDVSHFFQHKKNLEDFDQ